MVEGQYLDFVAPGSNLGVVPVFVLAPLLSAYFLHSMKYDDNETEPIEIPLIIDKIGEK